MTKMTEFDFELSEPFVYSAEKREAKFLKAKCPTANERKKCRDIFQKFMRAVHQYNKLVDDQTVQDPDTVVDDQGSDGLLSVAPRVLIGVVAASDEDLDGFLNSLEKLVTGKLVCIDGDERELLTSVYFDRMSEQDQEEFCIKFLQNFILRSRLGSQKNN